MKIFYDRQTKLPKPLIFSGSGQISPPGHAPTSTPTFVKHANFYRLKTEKYGNRLKK